MDRPQQYRQFQQVGREDDLDDRFRYQGKYLSCLVNHQMEGRAASKLYRFYPYPETLHTHTQILGRVCERFGNRRKTAKDLH